VVIATNDNIEKAVIILKKAEQWQWKIDCKANEGISESSIHNGGRIDILIELNYKINFAIKIRNLSN
jgi:translation elongation factor EF-Ts